MSTYGKLIVAFSIMAGVFGVVAGVAQGDSTSICLAGAVCSLAAGNIFSQFTIANLEGYNLISPHEETRE